MAADDLKDAGELTPRSLPPTLNRSQTIDEQPPAADSTSCGGSSYQETIKANRVEFVVLRNKRRKLISQLRL
eukprot:2744482-Amphidinium_carterae.1